MVEPYSEADIHMEKPTHEFDECLRESTNKSLELRVRVQAIRKLPLLCKDRPEFVSKITDALVQCLNTDQEEQRDSVHEAFVSLFQQENLTDLFKKLSEPRKLDLLKALAEISPHTTALVTPLMLPSIVQLLKKYMTARKTMEKSDSRYVECLLYMFHHMAHKVPNETNSLCGYKFETRQQSDRIREDFSELYKEFTEGLTSLQDVIKSLMEQLVQEMSDHDKANLNNESMSGDEEASLYTRRQTTKTGLRTCINILAMTEVLHAEAPSFIGDVVNLSWKETKKLRNLDRGSMGYLFDKPPDMTALYELTENIISDELSMKLDEEKFLELETEHVQVLVGSSGLQQVQQTFPESRLVLYESPEVACLFWMISQSAFLKFVTAESWKGILGCIRNQLCHLLCWAYGASDLVSAMRIIRNWERENLPLCPWYLCTFCHPENIGQDERAEKPHVCYGNTMEDALLYIKEYGIPREICKEFDCADHEPPNSDEPLMDKKKIKSVRTIQSMEEALLLVRDHPIGADLVVFDGMWKTTEIYYGPKPGYPCFRSYHAVIISSVEEYKGEVVAYCKMSNGIEAGYEGYLRVSLATMFMVVGVVPEKMNFFRGTPKPEHLLSNFVILDMDENKKEKETERGRKREREKESPGGDEGS